jgi:hypothetical protein
MATDYHNGHRSHPPDYRTQSGSSNGWLLVLATAALVGLLAFFSFTGAQRPVTSSAPAGTTSAASTAQPAPVTAPAD